MKKIEVVAGIIIFGDEILCMQRNSSKYEYLSYKFEFPGGKVEPGESRVDALKRELMEEMDMEVIVEEKDFFLTVQHAYPDFEVEMHSYVCKARDKEFVLKEHAGHKWLKKSELLTLDWVPADLPIVDKIIGGALIMNLQDITDSLNTGFIDGSAVSLEEYQPRLLINDNKRGRNSMQRDIFLKKKRHIL